MRLSSLQEPWETLYGTPGSKLLDFVPVGGVVILEFDRRVLHFFVGEARSKAEWRKELGVLERLLVLAGVDEVLFASPCRAASTKVTNPGGLQFSDAVVLMWLDIDGNCRLCVVARDGPIADGVPKDLFCSPFRAFGHPRREVIERERTAYRLTAESHLRRLIEGLANGS